jgi:hypothetical protein
MLISNPLKKCKKFLQKKVISIKVYKLYAFSTFSTVYKSSQPCNFLHVHFLLLFQRFKISIKFLMIPILKIFGKIYFLGHISTFCKLLSQTRMKWRKKTKNVFYKCVLEFTFSSIYGSGLLIFLKKVKLL